MSRWFRFYDGAIHDTKILRLSDATFRAWVTLLCIASKNNGALPSAADIAVELRCKPAVVAGWITELVGAGLLDKASDCFTPHNWTERQYKSDSSAERMKRHRDKKRDATGDVTVTVQNRTETESETEQRQKDAEPEGSGADAPRDVRAELFNRGLETLARITGKGSDACRSFVGKCLKASSDDAVTVLGLIEDAERNRVVDPSAWIAARLKTTGPPTGKPLTEFQRKQQETNDVRAQLRNYANGGGSGGNADRLLSNDSGERPEDLRGGPSSTLLAISRAPDRGSH